MSTVIESADDPHNDLLVRVLGEPCLPTDPTVGGRPLQIIVYLACRDTPASTGHILHAIWDGEAVTSAAVKSAVHVARCVLKMLTKGAAQIVTSRRGIGQVRATDGVVTDLTLLRSLYRDACDAPPKEAVDLLTSGLSLVHGPPFDAPGYDWAYHTGMDTLDAELLIERVVKRLVDLALDLGCVDLAREAVRRGLRGLPGNEVLCRCGMRAERRAGNTAGIHAAYLQVIAFLDSLGLDPEPDPCTTALYEQLLHKHQRS